MRCAVCDRELTADEIAFLETDRDFLECTSGGHLVRVEHVANIGISALMDRLATEHPDRVKTFVRRRDESSG